MMVIIECLEQGDPGRDAKDTLMVIADRSLDRREESSWRLLVISHGGPSVDASGC
jgi:hypothetical protein